MACANTAMEPAASGSHPYSPPGSDIAIEVADDEPPKGAVETDLANIKQDKRSRIVKYFEKWRGGIDSHLPIPSKQDIWWGWLGAFLGILAVSYLDSVLYHEVRFPLLVASFGASAVLVYGVPESKLAQPRNLVGEIDR